MNKLKGIIFDLDGTLMNTLSDITLGINIMLEEFGLPLCSESEVITRIGNGARCLVERCIGECDEETLTRALDRYNSAYNSCFLKNTHPYHGIPETLTELKKRGVKLAVLSNKPDSQTRTIVKNLLPDCFCEIYGHRENLPHKPDPTAALEILGAMNISPENCAFVGDSDVDMQTGANAGTAKIGVTWGFRAPDTLVKNGADVIIDHPRRLLDFI